MAKQVTQETFDGVVKENVQEFEMSMAKQVTQETFDGVVKENVQEFEMSIEDAINDAVQQFESQGVNLGFIVRDPSLYDANGDKTVHPVIKALEDLSISLDKTDIDTNTGNSLDVIRKECDIDLTRRCFVGKNKAYDILIKSVRTHMDNDEMLVKVLDTLCSLCNGQPDLLDDEGGELLMKVMKEKTENKTITTLIVKLVRLNCIKHETNRRIFVKNGLIKELVRVVVRNRSEPEIVKEVSYGLRVLTQDDDIRVPFGSAHENAKQIVLEGDALKWLLEICKDYTNDLGVQGELFTTLSKLVVRNEFCKNVKDLGGLDLILKSFQENITNKSIVKQALGLLKALAGNDDIKIDIVKSDGIPLILAGMTQHQGNPQIAAGGCLTLATLVLRQPEHCGLVMTNNGHHVILQAMKIHKQDEAVQKNGCMAVRNLVARTREHCDPFLEFGVEEIINQARSVKNCEDEAKAALRDLGCHVDLKERWTGQGGSLQ